MTRRLLLVCGVVALVAGVAVAWCGAVMAADFADLSTAAALGDDGTIPAVVVLLLGAAIASTGVVVTTIAAGMNRNDVPITAVH